MTRRWQQRLHASRWLLVPAALTVTAAVWFGVNLKAPHAPVLLWIIPAVSSAVLVVRYWQISRMATLCAPTRRFWRHISLTTAAGVIGAVLQAVDFLRHPDVAGPHAPPYAAVFDAAAVVGLIYALYRLPLGTRTRGERLRVVLDAGTVAAASTTFVWQFHNRPQAAPGTDPAVTLAAEVFLMVLAAVSVLAVAKVVIQGSLYVNRSSLQLFGIGMVVGTASPFIDPLLHGHAHLTASQILTPILLFFCGLAGERQVAAASSSGRSAGERAQRRPFSMLPYVAVAAVDGLLLVVDWSPEHHRHRVVLVSAVVLTAVVAIRQLNAFQENGRLLTRLDFDATHDALTRLPNRAFFQERLRQALSAPANAGVSVGLIDLDDFKPVNDQLGHEVGDGLLIAVAERLAACVSTAGTVARLGGDEFVVVLNDIDPAGADAVARRVLDALAAPIAIEEHRLTVRTSIGLANGRTGDDPVDLLRRADVAMYAAKNGGGARCLHYAPSMAAPAGDHALGAVPHQAEGGPAAPDVRYAAAGRAPDVI
jgi:diguanylate cyclase (GGDEF)-like protein